MIRLPVYVQNAMVQIYSCIFVVLTRFYIFGMDINFLMCSHFFFAYALLPLLSFCPRFVEWLIVVLDGSGTTIWLGWRDVAI